MIQKRNQINASAYTRYVCMNVIMSVCIYVCLSVCMYVYILGMYVLSSHLSLVGSLKARSRFIFDLHDFKLQLLLSVIFLLLQFFLVSPSRLVDDDSRFVHRAIQGRCFARICQITTVDIKEKYMGYREEPTEKPCTSLFSRLLNVSLLLSLVLVDVI